ncbi:uncharacterized protein LOC110034036 [Phalaenopsis equestris]|uniref:uncharacterized protein LOC110034036 n=1 Tax=Phalaenopsis equestris TaxID=78828 RepID=UPI0009E294C5|nr:uncharacterized protein LOC110034036 [Phalaenopsis equestris]XP_020593929.1 uncharacterized protein LOC110034036 [Phalaenopsis equestris]
MGRREKDGWSLKRGICKGATLREENIGKKEVDVSSILKIKHLQKLAAWAGGEGGMPPLGGFFGQRLAATAEALGVPLDKAFFFCERCESNLQPGYNCTIRIEKCTNNKRRRSKMKSRSLQNNVIYTCNFCHHRNLINGTTKGHIKTLISSKEWKLDATSESKHHSSIKIDDRDPILKSDFYDQETPSTPMQQHNVSAKKKKWRKTSESESGKLELSSSRRKRKTWSSLKDIVEKKEAESNQNVSNYVIPFFMQA